MGQTGIKNTKTYQVEVVTLTHLNYMDMCISQREELEIRPWELKGERLKRLRVKGERLWVRDNNRVASVLQNFNNL